MRPAVRLRGDDELATAPAQGRVQSGVPVGGDHPAPVPDGSGPVRHACDGPLGLPGEQRVVVDEQGRTPGGAQLPGLHREVGVGPALVQRVSAVEDGGGGRGCRSHAPTL